MTLLRQLGLALCAAIVLATLGGCERFLKKAPVASVERLPYPTCEGQPLREGKLLHAGYLRSGPAMRDRLVSERYEFRDKGCFVVATVRQEWPAGTADIEVIFTKAYEPLRAWKRMTLPTRKDPAAEAEITLYQLTTDPPTVIHRNRTGKMEHFILRGGKPTAVVGPGRGLLSAWVKKAKLNVGGKSREKILDFRGLEKLDDVTIRRDADRAVPILGDVSVYSVFGRESVFVDDGDWVVGDLRGLLTDEHNKAPIPPAIPLFAKPDPVATP